MADMSDKEKLDIALNALRGIDALGGPDTFHPACNLTHEEQLRERLSVAKRVSHEALEKMGALHGWR